MVNLTIDDKQVTVAKDATIYDAAKAAGIRIPILCHDKKLHPFGGCRMCLVEVEQMKGRLIPACTTPVTEGMIVRTTNDEILKARKMVLELLLLKHPIDCPVCDAAGDCDLQNLTYEYKVNVNPLTDEKFHWDIDYENPLIERDQNRCIHCGKCSRICDEIVSFGAYSFVNRGIEAKIGTPFDGKLDCEYCGSCISVCPVGALISRPFKFKARWWSLNKVKSVCSYCGTGCQITLGVKDNKVLTTVYDEDQGFHNGQLCSRGRFGYQYINSDKRLKTPLIRKNGSLVPASWDEALKLVSDKFVAAKGDSFGCVVTPRLTNEELYVVKKLVNDGLGSNNIDHSAGYAHAALTKGALSSLGHASSPSVIADIQKSDLLLVVKTDAYETHPVIGFEINLGVKRKDIDLRIISDKKGKLAKLPKAVTYLHKVGSEVAVVNSLAYVIVSEGLMAADAANLPGFAELKSSLDAYAPEKVAAAVGITAEEIASLARDYAKAEKALIVMPLGLAYPGHGPELAHAVLNLSLLAGKVGKEGSGVLIMAEKNNSQGAVDVGISPANGGKDALTILESCKTLYLIGENPIVSYPNRAKIENAIDKAEFVVVQDLFLTETAAKADVVLPACSFAEKDGTFTSVGRAVTRVTKAIPPVGESRTDFEICKSLYASVTGGESFGSVQDVFAKIPAYSGIAYPGTGTDGMIYPVKTSARLVPVEGKVVQAEEGKFALLIGSALYHCGTLSLRGEGTTAVCPEGYVEFSRGDAADLNIAEGDLVSVKSALGEIKVKAKVGVRMPKGVLFAPYHFNEQSVNTITSGEPITWVSIGK